MDKQYNLQDAIQTVSSDPIGFLIDALHTEGAQKAPYLRLTLLLITWLFVIEVALMIRYNVGNVRDVVAFFFINEPWLAWPVAPLLHKGLGHVTMNVVGIYVAAPIVRHFGRIQYVMFLLFAGYLPVYADGVKFFLLGDAPHIGVYGASALAFGLFGYAIATAVTTGRKFTSREWLIVFFGVGAVLTVGLDLVFSLDNPIDLNLGHFGGLIVGAGFRYVEERLHRSSPGRPPGS